MKLAIIKITLATISLLLFGAAQTVSNNGNPKLPAQVSNTLVDSTGNPAKFGWGKIATLDEISAWDIDVRPDGTGLPKGVGYVQPGKTLFIAKCAICHGTDGKGGTNGALVTPPPDSIGRRKEKTIGNYWPYATTVYDYIRRAMPYNQPGSLTNEEVYHLTAFLLHANGIVPDSVALDSAALASVKMPAEKLFVPDDRKGGPEIR